MLGAGVHHGEYTLDLFQRELAMKDVRHAVDEHSLWFTPAEWLHQSIIPEARREWVGSVVGCVLHRRLAEVYIASLRQRQREGVAVIAPRGNL
jgi:hypothetical protein